MARIEYKFNGWHDPDDGRFTEAGAGRYFPQGSSASRSGERLAMAHPPRNQSKRTLQGGGFTGGGGSFGGGGATGSGWETPQERHARERQVRSRGAAIVSTASKRKAQTKYTIRNGDTITSVATREKMTIAQLAAVNSISDPDKINAGQQIIIPAKVEGKPTWVSVSVDQLKFEIDEPGRTRVIDGKLGREDRGRSRRLQAQAGGPDRRVTDDGGHFVAPRFGGPKETFNHFAQNANFNRGAYRVLEDSWAAAQRKGDQVDVSMDITYPSNSQRPSSLVVQSNIAGKVKFSEFDNEKGGSR